MICTNIVWELQKWVDGWVGFFWGHRVDRMMVAVFLVSQNTGRSRDTFYSWQYFRWNTSTFPGTPWQNPKGMVKERHLFFFWSSTSLDLMSWFPQQKNTMMFQSLGGSCLGLPGCQWPPELLHFSAPGITLNLHLPLSLGGGRTRCPFLRGFLRITL